MKKNNILIRIGVGAISALIVSSGISHALVPAVDTLPSVKWQVDSASSGDLSYVLNPQYFSGSTNIKSHLRSTFVSGTYKLKLDMSFAQNVQVGDTTGVGVEVAIESDPLVLSTGDFTDVNSNAEVVLDDANVNKAVVRMLYGWSDKDYRLGVRQLEGGGLELYVTNTQTETTKIITKLHASEPEVWTMDSTVQPQTDFAISPAATDCNNVPKATFQILEVRHGENVLMADESTVYPSGYNFACPGKQIISYHAGFYRFSRGSYIENISNLGSGKNVLIGSMGYENAYYNSPNPTADLVVMNGADPVVSGITSILNSNDWQNFKAISNSSGGLFLTGVNSLPGMYETARMFVPYTSGHNQLIFCPDATSIDTATTACSNQVVYEQTAEGQEFVSSNGRVYWSFPLRGGAFIQTSGFKPGGAPGSETSGSTGNGQTGGGSTSNGSGGSTTNGTGSTTPPPTATGVLGTSASFEPAKSNTESAAGKPAASQVLGASAVLSNTGTNVIGIVAGVVLALLAYLRLTKRSKYRLES